MTREIWKDIQGYQGIYQISSLGRVKSLKSKRIKKLSKGNHGYLTSTLYKNNKSKTYLVHRLVAQTFLPNNHNKPTVNHKDGDKENNSYDNLEWNTYSENHSHSYANLGRVAWAKGKRGALNHNSKKVVMIDPNDGSRKYFDSIADAERETGIQNSCIVQCLKGKNKTSGGYKWDYAL